MKKISILKRKNLKNINSIFNILNIYNEYLEVLDKGKRKKVYIFKIEPIPIISISDNESEIIIDKYKEFLRDINVNFSIYIENIKINIFDYYFKSQNFKDNSNVLLNEYRKEFEKNVNDNNIYNTNYYIIVSINIKENISKVVNSINTLNILGNEVKLIKGKDNIEKIIYNSINKVNEYE